MTKIKAFKNLKRVPAYTQAEESIRSMILDGTLAPGELLPVEHDLADQLGITRPTIREALRKLESSGLVERGPRRRLQVSAPSSRITTQAMHQAIVLHGVSYRELWELNMALEPTAAALAAERIDSQQLARLEANLVRTQSCIDKPEELVDADIEFHELIAMATGNHALFLARAPLGEFLFSAYGTVVEKVGPGKRLLEAHTKIVEAIRNRDADTAREWMKKHFRDFLRGCELAGISVDDPIRQVSQAMNIIHYHGHKNS